MELCWGSKFVIKYMLIENNITLTDLVKMLNEKHNKSISIQNLSNKINRDSLKSVELLQIIEILGYDIVKRSNKKADE